MSYQLSAFSYQFPAISTRWLFQEQIRRTGPAAEGWAASRFDLRADS
jgi:hypothetical protein